MLRIRQFSKFLVYKSIRSSIISTQELNTNSVKNEVIHFIRRYSSKNKDQDRKVSKGKDEKNPAIQSHPCANAPENTSSQQSSSIKLKECKPINIIPCRPPPAGYKKIPSIQDCPTPNLMSQLPEPTCSFDEEDKKYRKKARTILWIGILLTAVTIGTAWFVGVFDQEKKVKKVKVVEIKKSKTGKLKIPPTSQDIPQDVPYLLIGGGTASFTAFRAIKSVNPTAKVLVITDEAYFPYMRPPLSKEIWFNDDKEAVKKLIFKQWNGSERSLFYEPDDFYIDCKELMDSSNGGVAVARGWTISQIDVVEKTATLDDGAQIHYDKCLIATGASPKLSPVFEVAVNDPNIKDTVKVFRNIYDFEQVNELFDKSKSIAIVGGGFLGSELACAMARKDKKHSKQIYQIFREAGNMGKILPEYLSFWTTDKVKAEGVHVLPKTEVVGVKSEGTGLQLTLDNGKILNVDYALVTVGVVPNTQLAEDSDLEVDPELGGYLVNTELQARSDLYIAGDCACFYDAKLGRRRVEHHDHAVVTGRLAGENMAGGRKPYLHQSMFWSDLGPDVGYEAIGIVDSSLPTVAVFAKATDKDNPKAVVTATDEGIRSNTEEIPPECDKYVSDELKSKLQEERREKSQPNKADGEDFGKGIIFYLRNDIVVGIVLWNVFNRMSIARQVLKDQKKYDDLNEVAKLFNIHEE